MLNGIDISSWQGGIDVSKVQADFVIVKVSGGTSYVNDRAHGAWKDWRDIADAVIKAGKLLGLYHYAGEYGIKRTGKAEAEFFLKQIEGYEGKAVLCLDWEADATGFGVSYAKSWLNAVAKATNSTPLFYSYASYLNSHDLSAISKYPLWVASYPYKYENGNGYVSNPDMITGTGDWEKATIYQYSSTRIIKGYGSRLDVNVFYGTKSDWRKLSGKSAAPKDEKPKWQKMVEVAVGVAEDDSHGYSQYRRWPEQGDDFDCSSLMYYSADKAGYGVKMTDPRWTGSMEEDFTNAGFKKIAFNRSKLAEGDILLSHNQSRQHTELYIGGGETVGAHIAETGGIDGREGDQTGEEISIQALSWTPQWILRPPDSGAAPSEGGDEPSGEPVKYRSSVDKSGKKWLGTYSNIERDGYSGHFGKPIRWIAIDGVKRYRVFTEKYGWLPWVGKFDPSDLENGCAGDGSPILGIMVDDPTCRYAVHVMRGGGEWCADMVGLKDTGGSGDNFAGDLANRIDGIRMKRA